MIVSSPNQHYLEAIGELHNQGDTKPVHNLQRIQLITPNAKLKRDIPPCRPQVAKGG
jgi:hypothetical protein